MKAYLEQVLHQPVEEQAYEEQHRLPLSYRNAFDLRRLKIQGQAFLLAAPLEDMSLTELRKMRLPLERFTGIPCGFYLKKVTWYASAKMVEEGIPFVWEDHQVYLPFLGMLLKNTPQQGPKHCAQIAFLTQKLLLQALYENWQNVSAVEAATRLGVSRMSITRCYDEIEALGLPFLKTQQRSRRFYAMAEKQAMWETMRSCLRNPVIRRFRLEKQPEADMVLSGTTALGTYSLLGEDEYPTYAVKKEQIAALGIKKLREVPAEEEPACMV